MDKKTRRDSLKLASDQVSAVLSKAKGHKKHKHIHKLITLIGATLILLLNVALASGFSTQSFTPNSMNSVANSENMKNSSVCLSNRALSHHSGH